MSLSTYSGLIGAVSAALNRPDQFANIPDWIAALEFDLSLRLKRREMEQRATTSTVADQDAYELPADFGEAISMHINTTVVEILSPSDWGRIKTDWQDTGRPEAVCINQNEFLLGPTPDAVYTIELCYYKVLTALSGSSTTNWLITGFPQVYLFGTLATGADFMGDEPRGPTWRQAYERAIGNLLKQQVRDRGIGGGPILRADLPFGMGTHSNILTG